MKCDTLSVMGLLHALCTPPLRCKAGLSSEQGVLLQAIYVPADDLTDPAPATTFAHLDATTVLSRSIAELGIYPAVDPLDSTSRMLDVRIIGEEHYNTARGVQKVLQVRAAPSSHDDCPLLWMQILDMAFGRQKVLQERLQLSHNFPGHTACTVTTLPMVCVALVLTEKCTE